MVITTSHTIEGRTIKEYLGVVAAAGVVVMMGGPKQMTPSYQKGIDDVLGLLSKAAEDKGANGIVAVQVTRQKTDILAYGTAVTLA